jgi:hypothetical protein
MEKLLGALEEVNKAKHREDHQGDRDIVFQMNILVRNAAEAARAQLLKGYRRKNEWGINHGEGIGTIR